MRCQYRSGTVMDMDMDFGEVLESKFIGGRTGTSSEGDHRWRFLVCYKSEEVWRLGKLGL